jgi:hypothetical protein
VIFYKSTFTDLYITLSSNEVLGVLDSSYVEDYFGTDGYISLLHVSSGQRFSVALGHLPLVTPTIPFDVFRGSIAMSSLPAGEYQIQGRVRDVIGNYSILSAISSPLGIEQTQVLTFTLIDTLAQIPGITINMSSRNLRLDAINFSLMGGLTVGGSSLAPLPVIDIPPLAITPITINNRF